jgi:hypothetical protein
VIVGLQLIEALVGGAVAAAVYFLIAGWNTRAWVGLWLALALVILIGLVGPIKVG